MHEVPEPNRYAVWSDGTIQLIYCDGERSEAHTWMSDDFDVIAAESEEEAIAAWKAKSPMLKD